MRTAARILIVCVAAIYVAGYLLWQWFQPPSAGAMIANLARNRAAFERLLVMIHEDRGLERVDVDWTRPEDPASIGVDRERIATYRRLMRQIGVTRGFYAFEPRDEVSFIAYAAGLSIRGQSKSYVWSPSGKFEDAGMVESLDTVWRSGHRRIWDYRHVEGPWYLHLRVD
jgi:hypothetical protein